MSKTLQTQATIIEIGKRQVTSTGQFNMPLVVAKITEQGIDDWIPVSDIAKFVYGKAFKANNDRVRHYLWNVRRNLLARGFLLITEGRPAESLKIFVGGDYERSLAEPLVKRMHNRSDISAELYEKAVALLAEKEQPQSA